MSTKRRGQSSTIDADLFDAEMSSDGGERAEQDAQSGGSDSGSSGDESSSDNSSASDSSSSGSSSGSSGSATGSSVSSSEAESDAANASEVDENVSDEEEGGNDGGAARKDESEYEDGDEEDDDEEDAEENSSSEDGDYSSRSGSSSSGSGSDSDSTTGTSNRSVGRASPSDYTTRSSALTSKSNSPDNNERIQPRADNPSSSLSGRRRPARKVELPSDFVENAEIYGFRRSSRQKTKPQQQSQLSDSSASDEESDDYRPIKRKAVPSSGRRRKGGMSKKSSRTKGRSASTKKKNKNDGYILRDFLEERHSSGSESGSDAEFHPTSKYISKKKKKQARSKHMGSSSGRSASADAFSYANTAKRKATKGVVSYVEKESDEDVVSDDDELMDDDDFLPMPVKEEPEGECIERIMGERQGRIRDTGDTTTMYAARSEEQNALIRDGEATERQFLIKWKTWSHLHNTWESLDSLTVANARGTKKLDNYIKRQQEIVEAEKHATPEEVEYFRCQMEMVDDLNKQYTKPERIIAHRRSEDGTTQDYLVKWCGLPYSECSWEIFDLVALASPDKDIIGEFLRREQSECTPNKNSKVLRQRPKFVPLKEQPEYIGNKNKDLRLRDYQLVGVDWLTCCWCRENSCILADEMGLGKTIQSVSVLNRLHHQFQLYGPFLVVVPLSTIVAWQREFETWAPLLNTIVYIGDTMSRTRIREHEWMRGNKIKFNVLITTYEILLKDKMFLGSQINWAVLMVDEAHRLKNEDSLLYRTLQEFHTNHRVLITGTPLQNSLKELWALLHFIKPALFDSWERFQEDHSHFNEGDGTRLGELHHELEPFLLRRIKSNVETSLPAKVEQILRVDMTSAQKDAYRCIVTKNLGALRRETRSTSINVMMELKKCTNHLHLVSIPEEELQVRSLVDRIQAYTSGSGKMMLLDKLLVRLKETGHRVLIFSQMVRMLDILAEYLKLRRFQFQRLDGSIPDDLRKQALDHFNAEGSSDFCFLLSTRAGGLGINLASADTVIIFDSDWNPQNDLQAQARAHRIGQRKQVNIYRLVTKNTVEENIIERAKRKMVLDHLVIQRMDTTGRTVLSKNAKNAVPSFSKDELNAILKFGAEDLFKEDAERDKKLQDMDLDDILNRAEQQADQTLASQGNDLLSQFGQVADLSLMAQEWEKEATLPANTDSPKKLKAPTAAAAAGKDDSSSPKCMDDSYVEQAWEEIVPAEVLAEADRHEEEEHLKEMYLGPRARGDVNYNEGKVTRSASPSVGGKKPKSTKKRSVTSRKAAKGEDSSEESSNSDSDGKPKVRGRPRASKKDDVPGFTNNEVRNFVKSYKKFGLPLTRLDAIAADAQLTEKSTADLCRLGELIHDGCVDEEKKYDERLISDPNFDGKKRGATLKLAGMTINTSSVLKREKELEPLATCIPTNPEKRKNFRLTSRSKVVHWGIEWSVLDDAMLLIGMYEYGVGSWLAIKEDLKLGLADKILPADETKKPQGKHLQTRAEALLKLLQEEIKMASSQKTSVLPRPKIRQPKKEIPSGDKDIGKMPPLEPISASLEKAPHSLPNGGPLPTSKTSAEAPTKKPKSTSKAKQSSTKESVHNGSASTSVTMTTASLPTNMPVGSKTSALSTGEKTDSSAAKSQQECKKLLKPVRGALLKLQSPDSALSDQERIAANSKNLLVVGNHIHHMLESMSSDDDKCKWRELFWDFIAQGLKTDASKLRNLYKLARKKQRQHGGSDPSERLPQDVNTLRTASPDLRSSSPNSMRAQDISALYKPSLLASSRRSTKPVSSGAATSTGSSRDRDRDRMGSSSSRDRDGREHSRQSYDKDSDRHRGGGGGSDDYRSSHHRRDNHRDRYYDDPRHRDGDSWHHGHQSKHGSSNSSGSSRQPFSSSPSRYSQSSSRSHQQQQSTSSTTANNSSSSNSTGATTAAAASTSVSSSQSQHSAPSAAAASSSSAKSVTPLTLGAPPPQVPYTPPKPGESQKRPGMPYGEHSPPLKKSRFHDPPP
ncbi:chromodomain-helicase-DNA-binding protein 1-like isoform X2 [Sycon ciliatum]|uniref:chromodomain-helicase-DNA-binding protein 1-like isoform X2 n=1 Tax=Sycon ciliatum TaxID=27933 RepID=UPI0031F68BF9